jgi:hypothetical protein
MQVSFIVTVENLANKATSLSLADRIPVSENKNIKVSRVRIAPAIRPNSQGLLHWELDLKPREKRQFRISYQVEYPSELVLDARRRKKMRRRAPRRAAPGDAPQPIEDQIVDYEELF